MFSMKKIIYINSIFLLFLLFLLFFLTDIHNIHFFYQIYIIALLILVVSSVNIYFIFRCLYQSYLGFVNINLFSIKTDNLNSENYIENQNRDFEIVNNDSNEQGLNTRYKPITFIPALCFSLVFISFCQFFISSYKLFDNFFIFCLSVSYLLYFLFYFLLKKLFSELDKKYIDFLLIRVIQPLNDNFKKALILLKYYQNKVFSKKNKINKKNMEQIVLPVLTWAILLILIDLVPIFFSVTSMSSILNLSTVTCFIYGLIYAFLDLDNKFHYSKISYDWIKSAKIYYGYLGGFLLIFFLFFYFALKFFDWDVLGTNMLKLAFDISINWYDLLLFIFSFFFFPLGVNISYLFLHRNFKPKRLNY